MLMSSLTQLNFNPRSRKGSDEDCMQNIEAILSISIHAPARGATFEGVDLETMQRISIHAPARGATAKAFDTLDVSTISIHAPARGATAYGILPPRM